MAALQAAPVTSVSGAVCDFCGTDQFVSAVLTARDYEYGVPGEWVLARCAGCGFYYQVPRPTSEQIASYYPSTYAVYGNDPVTGWIFRGFYWLEARRMIKLIGPQGRILDVGCGDGGLLAALRDRGSYDLYGVELDPGAAEYARGRGFRVHNGDISDANLPAGTFDLIRMGHVIEHFREPLRALQYAHTLLRPGGILYGETPNIDCLDFRLFQRYWGALHFPRHITLFSDRTLRRALAATGFTAVQLTPRLRTVGWSAGIQNLLADRVGMRVPPNGRVKWYPALILPFLPVTVTQSLLGKTATVAWIARKP
jgi:SAM-dependent methyltransferase